MNKMGIQKKNERLTNQLFVRIANEDEKWVATFDESVLPADVQSGHLPRVMYIVMCLNDFKVLTTFVCGKQRVDAECEIEGCQQHHMTS
jgi:hypothetical protein